MKSNISEVTEMIKFSAFLRWCIFMIIFLTSSSYFCCFCWVILVDSKCIVFFIAWSNLYLSHKVEDDFVLLASDSWLMRWIFAWKVLWYWVILDGGIGHSGFYCVSFRHLPFYLSLDDHLDSKIILLPLTMDLQRFLPVVLDSQLLMLILHFFMFFLLESLLLICSFPIFFFEFASKNFL